MTGKTMQLALSARTFTGAKGKCIDVEQFELLNRMLKAAEKRHSFRVVPRHRLGYLAHLYNLAVFKTFRTQDELDAFMLEQLRARAKGNGNG